MRSGGGVSGAAGAGRDRPMAARPLHELCGGPTTPASTAGSAAVAWGQLGRPPGGVGGHDGPSWPTALPYPAWSAAPPRRPHPADRRVCHFGPADVVGATLVGPAPRAARCPLTSRRCVPELAEFTLAFPGMIRHACGRGVCSSSSCGPRSSTVRRRPRPGRRHPPRCRRRVPGETPMRAAAGRAATGSCSQWAPSSPGKDLPRWCAASTPWPPTAPTCARDRRRRRVGRRGAHAPPSPRPPPRPDRAARAGSTSAPGDLLRRRRPAAPVGLRGLRAAPHRGHGRRRRRWWPAGPGRCPRSAGTAPTSSSPATRTASLPPWAGPRRRGAPPRWSSGHGAAGLRLGPGRPTGSPTCSRRRGRSPVTPRAAIGAGSRRGHHLR